MHKGGITMLLQVKIALFWTQSSMPGTKSSLVYKYQLLTIAFTSLTNDILFKKNYCSTLIWITIFTVHTPQLQKYVNKKRDDPLKRSAFDLIRDKSKSQS